MIDVLIRDIDEERIPGARLDTYEACHRSLLVQVWRNANPLSLDNIVLGDRARVTHATNEPRVDVTLLDLNFRHCAGSTMSGILSDTEHYTHNRFHEA